MDPISADPVDLLKALRWKAGMCVYNYEYDAWTWLCDSFDRSGKKNGITVCCLKDEPCDKHKVSA